MIGELSGHRGKKLHHVDIGGSQLLIATDNLLYCKICTYTFSGLNLCHEQAGKKFQDGFWQTFGFCTMTSSVVDHNFLFLTRLARNDS